MEPLDVIVLLCNSFNYMRVSIQLVAAIQINQLIDWAWQTTSLNLMSALLVFVTSADVLLKADPIHSWISHTAIVQLHGDLGSDAVVLTDGWATFHLVPHCKVLLHRCNVHKLLLFSNKLTTRKGYISLGILFLDCGKLGTDPSVQAVSLQVTF